MNKESVDNLISRLANKELSFGCEVLVNDEKEVGKVINFYPNLKSNENLTIYLNDGCSGVSGEDYVEVLGHHVMLGDVLKWTSVLTKANRVELMLRWEKVWFGESYINKSLQEIRDKSGFEKVCAWDGKKLNDGHTICCARPVTEQLKDPSARELFEFLDKINK